MSPEPSLTVQEQPSIQAPTPRFVLPEWIPEAEWNGWLEMRKKARKAPTPHAMTLVVRELLKLKGEGHDPAAVLDQSTRNCWQDVFPIRTNGNGHARQSWEEKKDADLKSTIARVTEQSLRGVGKAVR